MRYMSSSRKGWDAFEGGSVVPLINIRRPESVCFTRPEAVDTPHRETDGAAHGRYSVTPYSRSTASTAGVASASMRSLYDRDAAAASRRGYRTPDPADNSIRVNST